MPGMITHYICGEAVAERLTGELRDALAGDRELFNIGTQGPDIFFYYPKSYLTRRFWDIGSRMHDAGFAGFFGRAAECAAKTGGRAKAALTAYLCGFLSHYNLDAATHPYIYYKTGYGARNFTYHKSFETSIDILLLRAIHSEKPADKKLWQLLDVSPGEASLISSAIADSINGAYGSALTGKEIVSAMNSMKRFTRVTQSIKGRRKRLLSAAEQVFQAPGFFSSLIHDQAVDESIDFLNLAKTTWNLPWDDAVQSEASFTEMFDEAVESAVCCAWALLDYLHGQIALSELLNIIGDKSFTTGLNGSPKVAFSHCNIVYKNHR